MSRVLLLLCSMIVAMAEPPQSNAAAQAPASSAGAPETAPQEQAPVSQAPVSKMQPALEKQLASIRKQVTGYMAVGEANPGKGFLLPWPKPRAPASSISFREAIPCDPMPEADLERLVNEAAVRQKVSPKLVRAMITQESGGRPCAVSTAGAQGLMQLMPEVQQELAVDDPFDARQSVEAGTRLLRTLIDRYAGNVPKALAAYNAGPGAVDRASGIPPIPETIDYVAKIVKKIE